MGNIDTSIHRYIVMLNERSVIGLMRLTAVTMCIVYVEVEVEEVEGCKQANFTDPLSIVTCFKGIPFGPFGPFRCRALRHDPYGSTAMSSSSIQEHQTISSPLPTSHCM